MASKMLRSLEDEANDSSPLPIPPPLRGRGYLAVEFSMTKKSFFLFALLFVFSFGPPAHSEGDELLSKIGIQSMKDKRKAPDCTLEALNGERIQLKTFKGKMIFLNFWATWCGPCKEEMPSMEALYQKFKEKDFVFLTVAVDYGGAKRVKEFIEKQRYQFPVIVDPAGKTLDLFEINKIPSTLIIDKKGRIIGRAIGPRNWNSPEVVSLLNQTLLLSSAAVY
jgi:peroxiredoxin